MTDQGDVERERAGRERARQEEVLARLEQMATPDGRLRAPGQRAARIGLLLGVLLTVVSAAVGELAFGAQLAVAIAFFGVPALLLVALGLWVAARVADRGRGPGPTHPLARWAGRLGAVALGVVVLVAAPVITFVLVELWQARPWEG